MKYSLALIFDEKTNAELVELANSLGITVTKDWIPHCTILKYESDSDCKKQFSTITNKDIQVTLAGLTILPSSTGGAWIEIPLLQSEELRKIHDTAVNTCKQFKILSDYGDMFRPQIT